MTETSASSTPVSAGDWRATLTDERATARACCP